MKKPVKTRKPLLLFNIPIFGLTLYLIFFQSTWLLKSFSHLWLLTFFFAIIYFFIPLETATKKNHHSIFQIILSTVTPLSIPFIAFIFLYTPYHFLINYHPQYQPVLNQLNENLPIAMSLCTLLTMILAKIFNYLFYQTSHSGALKNIIVSYFNAPLAWDTTLELFIAFAIQMILLTYLSICALSLTEVSMHFFHLNLVTGVSVPLLLTIYIFFMLPKIPLIKKILTFLQMRNINSGKIYLFSALSAFLIWFLINLLLNQLPQKNFFWFNQPTLLNFFQPTATFSWILLLFCCSILLALLLATILVRLQKNYLTMINLPFALAISICSYLFSDMTKNLQLPSWVNISCLLLMIILIILSYKNIIANQVNLIGFLVNKNQLKFNRPSQRLIPCIQGIFISVGIYAAGGIYGLFFPIYLATLPSLTIILTTLICYPLLKYQIFRSK